MFTKKLVMKKVAIVWLFIGLFFFSVKEQNIFTYTTPAKEAKLKKLKAKVEANPANIEAHQAFISASKIDNPALEAQYKTWMRKFPKAYAVPFAIGEAYANEKNAKAIPFLLRAGILKPDNTDTWNMLKGNAYFTSNLPVRQGNIRKAMQYDPANANYAFDYAWSFQDTDLVRGDSLYLDVARRFPDSERGADALLMLIAHSSNQVEKIAYFKQLQAGKVNKLSLTYLYGMSEYFDLLLNINPDQAFELGLTMVLEDKLFQDVWNEKFKVASQFIQARKLLTENRPVQALNLLNLVIC